VHKSVIRKSTEEQKGAERAEYGTALIKELSREGLGTCIDR
jgi:hypothetical protein